MGLGGMEMKTLEARSARPRSTGPSFFCPERGKVSALIAAQLSMIALRALAWERPSGVSLIYDTGIEGTIVKEV